MGNLLYPDDLIITSNCTCSDPVLIRSHPRVLGSRTSASLGAYTVQPVTGVCLGAPYEVHADLSGQGTKSHSYSRTESGFEPSSAQSLSRVRLLATPWTAARQASLSITNSQSSPKLMSIELVMPSNHLILCRPFFSCPQSFPASGSFQKSQLFASCGQSIGVSASTSVLPVNTQV